MNIRVLPILLLTMLIPSGAAAAPAAILHDAWGFEDDVDIVVSPYRDFMVIPEEREDGSEARVRIMALGSREEPLGFVWMEDNNVLGFENGVDPIIIRQAGVVPRYIVLIPTELEDGSAAELLMLLTDDTGTELERQVLDLGNLGFREDVDCTWASYGNATAFLALESEDHLIQGVLAIDVDIGGGDWGDCVCLSTDGREVCGTNNVTAEWLLPLADAMDPVVMELLDRMRLALPVNTPEGSDILLLDFENDPFAPEPAFLPPHQSVKQVNAEGDRPLSFPGFEVDVDLVYLNSADCGLDAKGILVPVEGVGDDADLYFIDEDGVAVWTFSTDGGGGEHTILGYEAGVDILTICDLGGGYDPPHRLAVPIENAAGTDADLFILAVDNGQLLARVEDPTVNADLTLPGYEIGVDLVKWTPTVFVAAVEEADDNAALMAFSPSGTVLSTHLGGDVVGFVRSVDPIVAPLEPFPALIVPVGHDDGTDADILVFQTPPDLGAGFSLEEVNPDLHLNRFEWDVDLGLLNWSEQEDLYVCLPEESPGGAEARLRYEPVPGLPGDWVVTFATDKTTSISPGLYAADIPTGDLVVQVEDLLGLEAGLDMTTQVEPMSFGETPFYRYGYATGLDPDGDPTMVWISGSSGVEPEEPGDASPVPQIRLSHPNPFPALGSIRYVLPASGEVEVYVSDIAGRIVRHLLRAKQEAGEHVVLWQGRDDGDVPVASGVYFLRVRSNDRWVASKLLILK